MEGWTIRAGKGLVEVSPIPILRSELKMLPGSDSGSNIYTVKWKCYRVLTRVVTFQTVKCKLYE